jgi:ribosomal protein L3 glutamine methyltransferase
MSKLSHTAAELIAGTARRLRGADLHYGHGTDNPDDEAAALVFHALKLPWTGGPAVYRRRATAGQKAYLARLIQRRIRERVPAVYLTGETFFAGLRMRTDPRALVPRSPLAELIENRFQPFAKPQRLRRILDIGTGGGCIAIAVARYLPNCRVDAVDVSDAALALARENLRLHRLGRRVKLQKSDVYSALKRRRYDMILANPPYVGAREMARLPAEYAHEPRLALASGRDGLDVVRRILGQAAQHLRPKGVLVVEVGNSERAVRRAWPRAPFTWLSFARGGGGVFLLTAEQCRAIR